MPGPSFPFTSHRALSILRPVRIPLPLVLFCCACAIAAAWWSGFRDYDFTSPPSRARLQAVRLETQEAFSPPPSTLPEDVESPARSDDPPSAFADLPPPVEPTNNRTERPPTIQEYRDQAPKGAQFLISTAVLLETAKDPQRALLVWERVMDSTKPDSEELASAMSSVLRLRQSVPPWPDTAFHQRKVIVRADTAARNADALQPALEQLCSELSDAAAGIVKFEPDLRVTGNPKSKRSTPPVLLSFAGNQPESQHTPAISLIPAKPEFLLGELRRNAYQGIRDLLSKEEGMTPPAPWPKQPSAADLAFRSRLTRLHWLTFGVTIQRPPPPPDSPGQESTRKKTR